ncbi:ras-related protein Rab-32 isoform X1 [Halyomorpha halys]|uniref:ras-related protein Rab-32 isoform X1 n=1 Tax=Halyomorpha halys TaxID=286706 RepID=UPI0006D505A6|nr:ras-related protein Rab-32 isoform X1 [Halyomorpha halys]
MSDLGKTEAVKKQPKKKKKEGEVLSKPIAGKVSTPKKIKKKSDTQEVPQVSASPQPTAEDDNIPEGSNMVKDTKEQEVEGTKEDQVVNSEPSKPQPVDEGPLEKASAEIENDKKVEEVKKEEEVKNKIEEVRNKIEEVRFNNVEEDKGIIVHTPSKSAQYKANSNTKKECLYKILVIGELGTGKTSIIKRYVHQFFSQHYRATIGVDFALKVLNWDQNTIIRLQLWDIAGQERFGNMTRVYYKEAVGAFIVFDVTRASTFDAVVKWKQDLDAKVQLADGSPIPCVLLANKCDQQKEGIVNNPNKMNEYCEEHKFTAWFETSAKENINIEEAAKTLVDQIVRNDSSNENGRGGSRDSSKFPLESSEEFSEGKSCAC